MKWFVDVYGVWHAADIFKDGQSVYFCMYTFRLGQGKMRYSEKELPHDVWVCPDCRAAVTDAIVREQSVELSAKHLFGVKPVR